MSGAHLQAVMVGSGNPYQVLNDRRKQIVRALYEADSLSEIRVQLQLTEDALEDDLDALIQSSLVEKIGPTYKPTFLVANHNETSRVIRHAKSLGDKFHQQLLEDWDDLSDAFAQLTLSEKYSLHDIGFLLVGANILDIGLLECLAGDATLMPPAPHRPSPGYPDSYYYFWMIEGEPNDTGKYGQNAMPLPYDGWSFFTFGQYHVGQQFIEDRRSLEKNVLEDSQRQPSPQKLADLHSLVLVISTDIACWVPAVKQEAEHLLAIYKDNQQSIHDLHASLRYSTTDTFGEFFCWYDHLVYSHAIDRLEQLRLIHVPDGRYMGVLWEDDSGPGFFAPVDEA